MILSHIVKQIECVSVTHNQCLCKRLEKIHLIGIKHRRKCVTFH